MKSFIQRLLARSGRTLLPTTDEPILQDLLQAYRELRLRTDDLSLWHHRLSRVAAMGHLRDLLAKHRIGCVFDVGANTGQFALLLRKIGYGGRIVSFEPMDQARAELERAAAGDPDWTVSPLALGAKPVDLELRIFADDTFSSLHDLRDEASTVFGEYVRQTGMQRVQVARLDDLWESLIGQKKSCPVLLKTDTQGHDLEVLQGAKHSLSAVAVVMTEVSIERIYEDSPTFFEIAAFLEQVGFSASGYYPLSLRPESLAMIEMDAFFVRRSPTELSLA
jgi:FkbM family methyltransferase